MEKRFHPFRDMKESAKAQHEVDKAQFEAVKARSKANREEAKALGKTESRKKPEQEQRDELIAEANAARAEAEERIARLRNLNGKKD